MKEISAKQPDADLATEVNPLTTQFGQPTPSEKVDEMENRDNYDGTLAFDDTEDLLVPRTADVAIDDPDGNGELVLGAVQANTLCACF